MNKFMGFKSVRFEQMLRYQVLKECAKWVDRAEAAEAEVARLKEERRAILNVKTREGLLASEWLARTALAEAELKQVREEHDALRERVERLEEVVRYAAGLAESGPWDSGADYERNRQLLLKKCRNVFLQPAPSKSMVRYVHTCGLEEEYEDTGQTREPNCPEMGVGRDGRPCRVTVEHPGRCLAKSRGGGKA